MNLKRYLVKTIIALPLLGMASLSFAQSWNFVASDEAGLLGDVVEVTVTIEHVGTEEAWAADLQVSDLGAFDSVDFSQCMSAFPPAFIQTCGFRPAPDEDVIRIQWSSDAAGNSWPESAVATLLFEIGGTASVGDVIDLTWINLNVNGTSESTDGSIEVLDVPPTDANLVIAPASHDFGSQDINDGAQTFDFTVSNDGVEDSLEIGTASVGGAPYSASANCDGQTLAPGGTCVVTVTFDPATTGTFSDTLTVTSDVNNVSADLDGAATASANIVVTPAFGPVNLGTGAPGDTLTANGTVQNTGSADADLSCTLTGDGEISTDPSPLAATIGAGETVPFSLACALPAEAEEGETFSATLSCNVDGELAGTHEISCGVSTFEPLPVPTMQAWALALFALMMLLAGAIGIRFFRA